MTTGTSGTTGTFSVVSCIVVAGLLGVAFVVGRGRVGDNLPYYDGRDFTPRWAEATHRIGAFSLLSQSGDAFTDRDLAGRVHIASFIYTRCSAVCPTLVANLRRVDRSVANPALRFVAYSVTPDLDTPGVLADFGREHNLDPARWTLVTGDKSQIYRLARESYFADDERITATIAEPDAFLHTEKVVLVDRDGRLRGVYDATQSFDMDKLIEDAIRLLSYPTTTP